MPEKQMTFAHDTTPTMEEIMTAWGAKDLKWKSRKEIADALGRAKSPSLIAMLGIAAGTGILLRKAVRLPNGVDMFMYRPPNPAVYEDRR